MSISFSNLINTFNTTSFSKVQGKILSFVGADGFDTYNPCVVIDGGQKYLAVRVESRQSHWLDEKVYDPRIIFFKQDQHTFIPVESAPIIENAEDPFVSYIKEGNSQKLVFGFVRVNRDTDPPTITTHFLLSDSIFDLNHDNCFLEVSGMKDVRLLQLPTGEIVVCGRPQHELKKQVSLVVIPSLAGLNEKLIKDAPIISSHIEPNTFLGNNEMHLYKNKIVTLGHIATETQDKHLHYAAALWEIDIKNQTITTPQVIATRNNFPIGKSKEDILQDVVFPGSIEMDDNFLRLTAGLSDAECGELLIPMPF